MKITKNQARFFHYLKNDYIQHFLYGLCVFGVILGAFIFHEWYNKQREPSSSVEERIIALFPILAKAMVYTLFMAIPVYINLFFFSVYRGRIDKIMGWEIIPPPRLKGWGFPIFLLISSLVALAFAFPLSSFFQRVLGGTIPAPWGSVFIIAELLTLVSTAAKYAKDTIELNRELERRKRLEDIRRIRSLENALGFIKKQIRPHFLFNTLQNLKILAWKKSDDLPMLMDQLSVLLRYLFREANKKLVSVEKEIEFIRGYIELEKLSLSRNTRLTFDVEGFEIEGEEAPQIAPMLLLNLVENCFKHYDKGSEEEKQIQIHICLGDGKATLSTLNTFEPGIQNEHSTVESNEVGLKTLTESLALIYEDQYQFEIKVEPPYFITHLQIPLQ